VSLSPADAADTRPLLRFTAQERRRTFYSKTDIALDDTTLRRLAERAQTDLVDRTSAIAELVRQHGHGGRVSPLAAGTFHVVHRVERVLDPPVVVRSTLSGLFWADEGLRLDQLARKWLDTAGLSSLVPETFAVGFAVNGAPFDFAISAVARGVPLRDLGDDTLDRSPAILESLGRALRSVHQVGGKGAGLLDCGKDATVEAAGGVHGSWQDYILLHLDEHVAACADEGFLDGALCDRIARAFRALTPELDRRPLRLLHGDPGIHNICVDPLTNEVTSLIDWEDALVGDPLFDVAMVASFQPERRMPGFLRGYGLEQPDRLDQAMIGLYFLRIALSKTVHRLRFGISDRPGRTPGHHRIYRGIESVERVIWA
jgi:hygromycin-B 4-O-kinase